MRHCHLTNRRRSFILIWSFPELSCHWCISAMLMILQWHNWLQVIFCSGHLAQLDRMGPYLFLWFSLQACFRIEGREERPSTSIELSCFTVTYYISLLKTVPVIALKFLYFRKSFHPKEIWMVDHPIERFESRHPYVHRVFLTTPAHTFHFNCCHLGSES